MGAIQLSLLQRGDPGAGFDAGFGTLQRTDMGRGAWVDYAPRWVVGDAEVYDAIRDSTEWNASRRRMYERMVDVPRLTASAIPAGGGHRLVRPMADALSRRYGVEFDAISLALYRNGQDSVTWHSDKGLREQPESTLAIVSVGEPRPFRLRPHGGGTSMGFRCGWGDLLVMGGTLQCHWEHAVPKVARAGPRIAVMFRCTRDTRLA